MLIDDPDDQTFSARTASSVLACLLRRQAGHNCGSEGVDIPLQARLLRSVVNQLGDGEVQRDHERDRADCIVSGDNVRHNGDAIPPGG
jgi:hypothetical protein